MPIIPLTEAQYDSCVKIADMDDLSDRQKRVLLCYGLFPSQKLVISQLSRMGHPITLKIGNRKLAIRYEEARQIQVESSAK